MKKHSGFTLVELMIVVVVLGVLAAMIVPQFTKASDKAKAAAVVTMVESLKSSCQRFYADTGKLATEYGSDSYKSAAQHNLSLDPGNISGWSGPYLEKPLTKNDNPWGSYAYLYASIHSTASGGFDLTGGGTDTHTNGNSLLLNGITEDIGEQIDAMIDGGGIGGGTWQSTGRVEWSGNKAVILVFSP